MIQAPSSLPPFDESRVVQFESAWNRASEPLDGFLPPTHDPRYLATLVQLIKSELVFLWRTFREQVKANGVSTVPNPPPVEDYIRRFPCLSSHPGQVLELAREEFYLRHQYGDRPPASEYPLRFRGVVGRGRDVECILDKKEGGVSVGPKLPGYEISRLLGRGGMGIVWLARCQQLKRWVAIKTLNGSSPRSRFFAEAEAAARLQHPNIVQIHAVGEHEGLHFLVLEFVDGDSLENKIRPDDTTRAPLPPRNAAALVEDLARAMHYAHQKGVVHRDLKPGNILLALTGGKVTPKIADFGLAKRLDDTDGQTRQGDVCGTPFYMAPEQATGDLARIGPRTDVYGLGATLYALLTAHAPFSGGGKPIQEQVKEDRPAPPRELRPAIPQELETIVLMCLEKEPGDRYGTAEQLAEDLRRFLAGEPIAARPIGRAKRLVKWSRRRPAQAGLMVAAVVVLVVAGLLWVSNAGREASAAELARVEHETATAVEQAVEKSRHLRASARTAKLDEISDLFREAHCHARLAGEQAERGPASEETRETAAAALAEARADVAAWSRDRRLMARMLEVLIAVDGAETRALVQAGYASAERHFVEAFREWGLDPDRDPVADAARRIQARPAAAAVELVAALDHWAYVRRATNHDGTQRLFDLVNRADGLDRRRRELRERLARTRLWAGGPKLDRRQVAELAEAVDPAQEPTLTLVVLARALWEVEEPDKMEAILRAAVLARPSDELLRGHLGSMYLTRGILTAYGPTGKMVQALMQGELLPADWWKNSAASREKAAPHFQEAVGCFDVLRTSRPEAALPYAVALLQTPRQEEGLTLLRKLVAERPEDTLLQLVQSHALLLQGKLAEAAEAVRKAGGAGGNTDLAHVARLSEAQSAIEARDWKKAERLCRDVLAASKSTATRALAYERLGAALHGEARVPEAIVAFGESLRLSQGIPSGHVYLAQKLEQENDLDGADRLLARGLTEDPDNASLLLYAVGFLRRQGKEQDAIKLQKKIAGARFPPDIPSLYTLGKGLLDIRADEAAEKVCRRLIELDADHFAGNLNLAGTLNQAGKCKEAEPPARKAVKLNEGSHLSHHVLGWSLYGQGRFAEAEEPLRRAVELGPDYPPSPMMLGDALRQLKQYKEAEAFLRKGIELSPRDPRGYGWLSEVLRELGRVKEADEMYSRAVELSRRSNR